MGHERRVKPLLLPMTDGGSDPSSGERALAELSHCGRNAALRSVQSGRARTASYAHGRSASVECGLGQLKVALRPRSLSSQPGASRIEWKFDFSCREWMDCLVECEQLGSAGSMRCNAFSGGQQTRARERVLNRTLHSNTQDTIPMGVHVFLFGFGAQEYTLGDETEAGWPRGGFIARGGLAG